ncbi:MAG TPA: tryptophan synthase subunit beta [Bacteroidales bacterium]|nr:tryptophan synthase subunit beta [Bacteroidales bacterium]
MNTNTLKNTEATIKAKNESGYFGVYGGTFVPSVLEPKLNELSEVFKQLKNNNDFMNEFHYYLKQYVGRPSPLYFAKRLSAYVGSKIYLKREDLNHTGAHKINNTIGQILVAKYMGAKEIIAETGAGQHGVATATAAAMFGMKCKIFMGQTDAERQQLNVYRIKLLGAKFITTNRGTGTLKDAVDAALEYYIENPDSFYILGSVVGPHPYPSMVRFFQSEIGTESRKQIIEQEGKLPDSIFACVGGGSNAIGLFSGFLEDENVKIFAAEGGGEGLFLGKTASTIVMGKPMVFQGTYSYCLADEDENPVDTYSIAAGLDYPGVGPEHAFLNDTKRAEYHCITDDEAIKSFKLLSILEGIIPAIESSHAVALAFKLLKHKNALSIINLSGRGDKDIDRRLI